MKHIIALSCMLTLAACSSEDDSLVIDIETDEDSIVIDVDPDDVVAADPVAVFVTPEMIDFQDTPFPGVALAQAFSDPMDGSHETFVQGNLCCRS